MPNTEVNIYLMGYDRLIKNDTKLQHGNVYVTILKEVDNEMFLSYRLYVIQKMKVTGIVK